MRPEIFELSDFHQYIDGVFNIIHSLSILLSIIMIDNKIDNDIVCGWAALGMILSYSHNFLKKKKAFPPRSSKDWIVR